MGTEVFYENNYFEDSSEIRNGYSLTVLSARIIKTEEFLKNNEIDKINISADDENPMAQYLPEYVYDVVVKVRNINNNNEECGIDLYNTVLATDDASLRVDDNIWSALYPQLNGLKQFKLVENSEAIIHFPYALSYCDSDTHKMKNDFLFKNKFQLVMSKYPVDLRINIRL